MIGFEFEKEIDDSANNNSNSRGYSVINLVNAFGVFIFEMIEAFLK